MCRFDPFDIECGFLDGIFFDNDVVGTGKDGRRWKGIGVSEYYLTVFSFPSSISHGVGFGLWGRGGAVGTGRG